MEVVEVEFVGTWEIVPAESLGGCSADTGDWRGGQLLLFFELSKLMAF